MNNHVEREFGRNVTNAPAGKSSFLPPPHVNKTSPRSEDIGRTTTPHRKRNDRDADNNIVAVGTLKRQCVEETPRSAGIQNTEGKDKEKRSGSPARSTSDSVGSIERCFDEDLETVQGLSAVCMEMLGAVEQSAATVMDELCCTSDNVHTSPLSLLLPSGVTDNLLPPPAPPVLPLLFDIPQTL